MDALRHRRQVGLFFVAVLFPSAVLVVLGLRMIGQDRELAEKRLADDRRHMVTEVRQILRGELESLVFAELSALASTQDGFSSRAYRDSAIRLVTPIQNGHVVLPRPVDIRCTSPLSKSNE